MTVPVGPTPPRPGRDSDKQKPFRATPGSKRGRAPNSPGGYLMKIRQHPLFVVDGAGVPPSRARRLGDGASVVEYDQAGRWQPMYRWRTQYVVPAPGLIARTAS